MNQKVKALCLLLALFVFGGGTALADLVSDLGSSTNTFSGTITLNSDVTLGQTLYINGDVTIEGKNNSILRAEDFTGTFFVVNAAGSLTLKNTIVDSGNEWTLDKDLYNQYLYNIETTNPKSLKYAIIDDPDNVDMYPLTSEKGKNDFGVNTDLIQVKGGSLTVENSKIKNYYSFSIAPKSVDSNGDSIIDYRYALSSGKSVITGSTGSQIKLDNSDITHCASGSGGAIINVSGEGIEVSLNNGSKITDNYGGSNGALLKIYSGANVIMNDAVISDNKGSDSNGTVAMLYVASMTMNDGVISDNSGLVGHNNGRNASIYLHNSSSFTMNGGKIIENTGASRGGIDSYKTNSNLIITNGIVAGNISTSGSDDPDIYTPGKTAISGGTFTQDVSAYLADGFTLWKNDNGTYSVLTQEEYDERMAELAAKAVPYLPQTGDNSALILWAALLSMSAAAFALRRKARA